MKKAVLVLVVTMAWTHPTRAQSRIFVAGDMFADLKRFSGDLSTPTLDGNAVGGGVSVGALVAGGWSISLDVDWSTSTTKTTNVPYPVGILDRLGNALPIPVFQSPTTSNRFITTSALLGYHVPGGHRVGLGVFGGLTFMHVRRTSDFFPPYVATASVLVTGPGGVTTTQPGIGSIPPSVGSALCCFPCCFVQRQDRIDNVPAATVGMEAAIELTSHLAAVPKVHAHAFSLSDGGPSGFTIRPGIGIKWTF